LIEAIGVDGICFSDNDCSSVQKCVPIKGSNGMLGINPFLSNFAGQCQLKAISSEGSLLSRLDMLQNNPGERKEPIGCRDFTLANCEPKERAFHVAKRGDLRQCQLMCQEPPVLRGAARSKHCQFFIWNKGNNDCMLFEFNIHTYDVSCKTIGGPTFPDVNTCQWIDDGIEDCQNFIEVDCDWKDFIDTRADVDDKRKCQTFCQQDPRCKYFIFLIHERKCKIFSSTKRTCKYIRGQINPNVEDCVSEWTSTTAVPTTPNTAPTTERPDIDPRDGECKDFTLSECNPPNDFFDITKEKDVFSCQATCQTYNEKRGYRDCQYFIWVKSRKTCMLYDSSPILYDMTCKTKGGPIYPKIDDCEWRYPGKYHDCQNFLESECDLSELIRNVEDKDTIQKCQKFCKINSECKFWSFEEGENGAGKCKMFDSKNRTCERIRGTPYPDYETCLTTPSPTTKYDWICSPGYECYFFVLNAIFMETNEARVSCKKLGGNLEMRTNVWDKKPPCNKNYDFNSFVGYISQYTRK